MNKHFLAAALPFVFTASTYAGFTELLGEVLLPPGFEIELVHQVDIKTQGSWVALTAVGDGRLLTSDQYGGLYVVTPGALPAENKVEKLPLEVGMAQGMSVVNGDLYFMVNDHRNERSGLHRARDTNGDGLWDKAELLRKLDGSGEHGPHAVIPSPDGKSLYVACGNMTRPTDFAWSRVPRVWQDDVLLPRMNDAPNMFAHLKPPGGWIAKTDLEGKRWELIATGFRNEYDIAFNKRGDLFTFDSDMEYEIDTPWYRPTRVCHVVSGAEFGWRHGTGKWPVRYEDSVPPAVNVGPGSPTGLTFGYDAKFPGKYKNCLFAGDWSHGRVFAITLTPNGGGYTGTVEPFLSASPLPVTDLAVNPKDGALYLTTGGRRIASALWRVQYAGDDPIKNVSDTALAIPSSSRQSIEKSFHADQKLSESDAGEQSLYYCWSYLDHDDRRMRYAARIGVELQPLESWKARALGEKEHSKRPYALLAAARCAPEESQTEILNALASTDFSNLSPEGRVTLLRAMGVRLSRYGIPAGDLREKLIQSLTGHFPTGEPIVDQELATVLLALGDPRAVATAVDLLADAPLVTERIHYAHALVQANKGWTPELRRRFYTALNELMAKSRRRSQEPYIDRLIVLADKKLDDASRAGVADLIAAREAIKSTPQEAKERPFVRKWTIDEVVKVAEGEQGDARRGRRLFAAAKCFDCHRFAGEGGTVGPDLTAVAKRFAMRDIATAIVDPNQTISDQYRQTTFSIDGKTVVGRIVNLNGDDVMIATDPTDPKHYLTVKQDDIEEQSPSKNSPMPAGLADVLSEQELRDLLTYLRSRK